MVKQSTAGGGLGLDAVYVHVCVLKTELDAYIATIGNHQTQVRDIAFDPKQVAPEILAIYGEKIFHPIQQKPLKWVPPKDLRGVTASEVRELSATESSIVLSGDVVVVSSEADSTTSEARTLRAKKAWETRRRRQLEVRERVVTTTPEPVSLGSSPLPLNGSGVEMLLVEITGRGSVSVRAIGNPTLSLSLSAPYKGALTLKSIGGVRWFVVSTRDIGLPESEWWDLESQKPEGVKVKLKKH
jgi:hypothetical protein